MHEAFKESCIWYNSKNSPTQTVRRRDLIYMEQVPRTVNYETYIKPNDLPPVETLEKNKRDPDEEFFIRTHQVFEIWFDQLIAELKYVRKLLSMTSVAENEIPGITHHLRRAAQIFDVLTRHLPLLETLDTKSFYDFRAEIFGGSGKQSYRFRQIEWLVGFRDPDLLEYVDDKSGHDQMDDPTHADSQERNSLKAYTEGLSRYVNYPNDGSGTGAALRESNADYLENGSFRKHLFEWLARTPFPGSPNPSPQHRVDFISKFKPKFRQAYEADVDMLRLRFGSQDSTKVDKALGRIDWYLSDRSRCAVLFILQFSDQPLLSGRAPSPHVLGQIHGNLSTQTSAGLIPRDTSIAKMIGDCGFDLLQ